ncbi:MAG: fumarate hydratase [Candidatus Aquicultorales bacterium]
MRIIAIPEITRKVSELALEANFKLRSDVLTALEKAMEVERSPRGRTTLRHLIENAAIAAGRSLPLCQDTGVVAVYIEMGNRVGIDGDIEAAVQEGVSRAYDEGYLRKSINRHPGFGMENTGDNTPASVEIRLVEGDALTLTVMPKGGGSENVSGLRMLPVSGGLEAVEDFVVEIAAASVSACPPLVLGVGIGGNFATVGGIAKKALLRRLDDSNPDERLAGLEERLLKKANGLGIGPGGLGGDVTALAVKVEERPSHIACLPVAVCVSCHALRSATGGIV